MSKKLIPLVAIVVVLGALGLWLKGPKQAPTLVEQTKLEALVPQDLEAKQLERLELFTTAKPDEKVELKREGEAWRVASHFNAPVKADTVNDYIEKLLGIKGEFRAQADTDDMLGGFNLKDDQAFRVRAYTASGEEPVVDLLVGKSPKYRTVFVRKAGDNRVFVESTDLRQEAGVYGDEADKAPTADKWLDKEVLKLDKDKIAKIALTMPGKELVFEKQGKEVEVEEPAKEGTAEEAAEGEEAKEEGEAAEEKEETPKKIEYEWVLAAGGAAKTHKQKGLDALLSKLSSLQASQVVDPAKKADWGLENPAFKAVISIEEGEDVVIEGGRPDPSGVGYVRLATAGNDVVYELSKYNFDPLFPKGEDLFDLPTLDLDAKQLTRIEIAQPEGKVVVAKDGDNWKVLEPVVDLEVQTSPLAALASTVAKWKAADYADAGTSAGEFTRKVTLTAGDAVHTIALADNSKAFDGAYARLDDAETILAMKGSDVKKVFLKPRDVYKLRLLDRIDGDNTTALELKYGDTSFSLAKKEDAWALDINGGAFDADGGKCEDFLSDLADLQADSFRLDTRPADVKVNTSVAVRMKDDRAVTCAFSAEQDGAYLMTVGGKNTVFEVTKSDGDALLAKLDALKTPKTPPEPEISAEQVAPPSEAPAAPEAAVSIEAPPVPETAVSIEAPAAPETVVTIEAPAVPETAVSIEAPAAPETVVSIEAPTAPQVAETPAP